MESSKAKLFSTLESILNVVTDIHTITGNQETILLYGSDGEILSQLAKNKQELITRLDELETHFHGIYTQTKESLTDTDDVRRLQGLVSQVVETKAAIAQAEEKNRRLWASKEAPKIQVKPMQQPSGYVASQYAKHSKKER